MVVAVPVIVGASFVLVTVIVNAAKLALKPDLSVTVITLFLLDMLSLK